MSGDVHVRFCESRGVRLPPATHLAGGAASLLGCPVLTGDPELRGAEAAGVAVRWLGGRA